jgi:transposase
MSRGRERSDSSREGSDFGVVHDSCAGLDVHKKTVTACVVRSGPGGSRVVKTRRFGTMAEDLGALARWLTDEGCTHLALEATGVSWRPVVNVLEDRFEVLVVNPEHIKALAGRKTDQKDAERLALLLRHGLLRGSFIPDRQQRELRDLTRARTALVQDRARVVNRLHKTLEAANIKLGAVLSDLCGASGQRILRELLAGETDPVRLADLADPRIQRTKREALEQALLGTLTPALQFLVREYLDQWQELERRIAAFDEAIAEQTRPFAADLARLQTIPAVSQRTAEIILAEVGPDLGRFPSAAHLAAWAGLAPGNRESAGKQRPARTRHGNRSLKAALTEAAWAASHCKDGFLRSRYHRLVKRLGRKRAIVALAHSIVISLYHILTTQTAYRDLGATYYQDRARAAQERRAVAYLQARGYQVLPAPTPPEHPPPQLAQEIA